MNIVLIAEEDVRPDGRVAIGGRRAHHIRTVLRAAAGDELRIGMIRGPLGLGRVVSVERGDAVLLEPAWRDAILEPPAIDLILAMPRPKALARVLQTCACMGVRRIDIVNAWRVDRSYLASPQLSADAVELNLRLGCEQGGITWVPEVAIHRLLMPFLRDSVRTRLAAGNTRAFIAHPRDAVPIERAYPQGGGDLCIIAAVGPERGWIDRELASFVELGFVSVFLGNTVLRYETAVTALLAQLSLLRRFFCRAC